VGTPVIDADSGTLYVVAHTKEPLQPPNNTIYVLVQRLHALDIGSGVERCSPAVIDASVSGTGAGNSGGTIRFNPTREVQRSGLLLANGVVYISWCSYCDNDPYHGWILAYDPTAWHKSGFSTLLPMECGAASGWVGPGRRRRRMGPFIVLLETALSIRRPARQILGQLCEITGNQSSGAGLLYSLEPIQPRLR